MLLAAVAACALVPVPVVAAAAPCWQRVIADWSRDGRIDHAYPAACYRQAVKRLPEDLRAYSSAPDDINRALSERRATERRVQHVAAPGRPVATADAGEGWNRLAVIVPGAVGIAVAAGLALWLLRSSRRDASP